MNINQCVSCDLSEHPVTSALTAVRFTQLSVELIKPEEEKRWNKLMRKEHYLKEHRLVGESLRYVAKQNGQWIALLGWSSSAYHLQDRDVWIGWSDAQRQVRRHLVACNSRFLILQKKSQNPNAASQILSLNLARLSEDWTLLYGHPILLVETFVDPKQFEGTCYRASNWTEIGLTKGFGRSHLDFYQLNGKPKAIFVYPVHPDGQLLLSAPVLPPALAPMERKATPHQYPLTLEQTTSLVQAFEALRDPRRRRGWRHRHTASILAIVAIAMIAGNNSLLAIGEFSASLSQNHLRELGAFRCHRSRKYLAPSESTIRRLIQRLDPDALDATVTGWLRSHLQNANISALAIDGKCARTASKISGKSIQLFSALDVQTQLVCRQIQIPSKRNEISSLKDLLEQLDLRGALVTADALNTQKKTPPIWSKSNTPTTYFPSKLINQSSTEN